MVYNKKEVRKRGFKKLIANLKVADKNGDYENKIYYKAQIEKRIKKYPELHK